MQFRSPRLVGGEGFGVVKVAEGYVRTKPDATWWMDQIHAGKEYRKKYAMEEKWDTWRAYLRGQWHRDVLPVNKYHSMLRSMIPRTYFRSPAVSINPC